MNNEIKEIVNGKVGFAFNRKDRDEILDLITDLQEVEINKYQTLKDLQQENERLNKRVKECEEAYLRTRHQYSELENKYLTDEHIINELEKWLKDNLGNCRTNTNYTSNQIYNLKEDTYHKCLNKLQELKGDGSNG